MAENKKIEDIARKLNLISIQFSKGYGVCLLYTSDAADE